MADFLPKSDPGLRDWTQNFSKLIAAHPGAYGLTPSDAAALAGVVGSFAEALRLATDRTTRTMGAVAGKNSARAAMLDTVRYYARVIKTNRGVTNEEKVLLGLNIPDAKSAAVPAPTTAPVCSIVGAIACQHTLRFADVASLTRRAKPPGVIGLELHYFVAPRNETAPASPDAAPEATRFYGLITRQPFVVTLEPADVGLTATYYARWITATGLTGPWSSPIRMTIAA
jgi:hypothetical protein